jgi:hypothetical protein
MATTTPNFGWAVPTSTDLVKDGAVAIETLGDSIDASLVDLKGGTTGQVLAKASGTDMDFTWTTASGGSNLFYAGKNKILNGAFNVWQRSTSATVTSENYFAPDRFRSTYVAGGATVTWSQQTFTPGAAPVAGYEGQYFSRIAATSGSGTTVIGINQRIEDVRTFAGQTATISFWAKADSTRTATILMLQFFGSGGSGDVTVLNTTQALTTSWARYSFTASVPSISGKTIGTGSYLVPFIYYNTGQASGSPQLDIWGVQLEAGSTATDFQTATGTLQGELAACQRYYYRQTAVESFSDFGLGFAISTTSARIEISMPVTMRVAATSLEYSTLILWDGSGTNTTVTSAALGEVGLQRLRLTIGVASGLTQYRPYSLLANNSTSAYVGFSAEL